MSEKVHQHKLSTAAKLGRRKKSESERRKHRSSSYRNRIEHRSSKEHRDRSKSRHSSSSKKHKKDAEGMSKEEKANKLKVADVLVKLLVPFLKNGHIACKSSFKVLARELTHRVLQAGPSWGGHLQHQGPEHRHRLLLPAEGGCQGGEGEGLGQELHSVSSYYCW